MKGLSKSRYTAFCQCPRMMWLNTYHPELAPANTTLQARFEQGNEVGDLAMTLFGESIDVTTKRADGSLDLQAMIELTRKEMDEGREVICEASFSFDGNYCAVDILRRHADGWSLYEVKSSAFHKASADTENYMLKYSRDIAYQKWVLEHCGLKVSGTYLVRIDSNYIRQGELNIHQFFHIKDMSEYVANEFLKVPANVRAARSILEEPTEPNETIGTRCRSPYTCGFFSHCVGELPEPNVFDLYRMSFKNKCRLFNDDKKSFADLKNERLGKGGKIQVSSFLNGTDLVDTKGIADFLENLSYPLYFLDFETMQPVIPIFDGTRPYQQITFQYSLHWIEEPGGELHHTEYLGNSIDDPRRGLAEQLCRDIPSNACVTAYNKVFERNRLNELAEEYPDLADYLRSISDNIVDLIDPFRKWMLYRPAMNGSFSIKKVLPALFPDNPELSYTNLAGNVHNGGDAMATYPSIASMDPEEATATRKALLEYCRLDTLAMVRIYERLKELTREI